MRILLILALALPVWAQPTITVAAVADKISDTGFRVFMRSSASGSTARVKVGTSTGSYTLRNRTWWNGSHNIATFIAGLTPATTYYVQLCSDSGGETCSPEFTVTTLSAQNYVAELPRSVPTRTRPVTTNTVTINADCDHPTEGLLATWNTISRNTTIIIPDGTECTDQYILPNKTGTDWIVIRGPRDSGRAPAGVRMDDRTALPKFIHNAPAMTDWRTGWGIPTTLSIGRLAWVPDEPDAVKLYQGRFTTTIPFASIDNTQSNLTYVTTGAHGLSPGDQVLIDQSTATGVQGLPDAIWQGNGYYTVDTVPASDRFTVNVPRNGTWASGGRIRRVQAVKVPYSTGSDTLPGTCTPDEWYLVTGQRKNRAGALSSSPQQRMYYCGRANKWYRVYLDNSRNYEVWAGNDEYYNGFGLRIETNNVWIEGVEFTTVDIAFSEHNIQSTPTSVNDYTGVWTFSRLLNDSNYRVVLDQVRMKPHILARTVYAMQMGGKDSALIDSHVENIVAWWPAPRLFGGDPAGAAINWGNTAEGPLLIDNNYLEAAGVGTAFSEDSDWQSDGRRLKDVTITRNLFRTKNAWRNGEADHALGECQTDLTGACTSIRVQRQSNMRHHLEFKDVKRVRVEGNIFENTWVGTNRAGSIALSSRVGANFPETLSCTTGSCSCGNGRCSTPFRRVDETIRINGELHTVVTTPGGGGFTISPASTVSTTDVMAWSDAPGVYDITIRNNEFRDISTLGYTLNDTNGRNSTGEIALTMENNLIYMKARMCGVSQWNSAGSWVGGCSGQAQTSAGSFQHIGAWTGMKRGWIVRQNAFLERGAATSLTVTGQWNPQQSSIDYGSFYRDENNIYQAKSISGAGQVWYGQLSNGSTGSGAAMASEYWLHGVTRSSNLVLSGVAMGASQPSDFLVYRTDQSGAFPFTSEGGLPYNSAYKAGGASGNKVSDIGVDTVALQDAQGRVRNARMVAVGSTTATVAFRAPDTTGCPVRLSADDGATWGSPISNAGGSKNQSVSLTGLTSATAYTVQILCPVEQPTIRFRTN